MKSFKRVLLEHLLFLSSLLLSLASSFVTTNMNWLRTHQTRRSHTHSNTGGAPGQAARKSSRLKVSASVSESSQLAQLAAMTTLSIDSGNLNVIQQYADTGYITDATTNPLFVSQAGLSGDPVYAAMVDTAVSYAIEEACGKGSSQEEDDEDSVVVALAMDRLAVILGKSISDIVPGYISTEVDPRLSFDVNASIRRARRIIRMYEMLGVPKKRVLIKLAATWEGIMAAHVLEQEDGIHCNLTLIFSVVQAIACAQYGIHLISPFPGRILDWYNTKRSHSSRTAGSSSSIIMDPEFDEGVVACRAMYHYFKAHGHRTICMPASWRPSRGPGFELDEIQALAGSDRMTIPAPLLERLAQCTDVLPRQLDPTQSLSLVASSSSGLFPLQGGGKMSEPEFRYRMNLDVCGTEKLTEGLNAFIGETSKLEKAITAKVKALQMEMEHSGSR